MPTTQTLIAQAYSAFNHRDIDCALALMSEDLSWSKASEGGLVVGKEEIRSNWIGQWKEFDPHVEPFGVIAKFSIQPLVVQRQINVDVAR